MEWTADLKECSEGMMEQRIEPTENRIDRTALSNETMGWSAGLMERTNDQINPSIHQLDRTVNLMRVTDVLMDAPRSGCNSHNALNQ